MVHRIHVLPARRATQDAVNGTDPSPRQVALERVAPEGHHDGRIEGPFLRVEVARAGGDLARLRVAVARRPALHDVGDEHVLALPADRPQQLGQQLTGRAHERTAGGIFASAGPLTHQQDVADRIPLAGDGPRSSACQGAARAAADVVGDRGERHRLGAHHRHRG
jgi:hypothetical protein